MTSLREWARKEREKENEEEEGGMRRLLVGGGSLVLAGAAFALAFYMFDGDGDEANADQSPSGRSSARAAPRRSAPTIEHNAYEIVEEFIPLDD